MNKNNGFSLIEVIIATGIAALLSSFLFAMVWQSNKVVGRSAFEVETEFKAMVLQRVLETDMSGACVPISFYARKEQLKQKEQEAQKKAEASKPAPTSAPKKAEQTSKIKSEARLGTIPALEKIFYAVPNDGQVLITFITNNQLPTYVSTAVGSLQPRLMRVVYRLKLETGPRGKSYSLWRQASADLKYASYEGTTIKAYKVADGIKDFKVHFYAIEAVVEGEQETASVELKEWVKDEQQEKQVPDLVNIECSFANERVQRSSEFNFAIRIFPDFAAQVAITEPTPPQPSAGLPGTLQPVPATPGRMPPSPDGSRSEPSALETKIALDMGKYVRKKDTITTMIQTMQGQG